MERPLVRGLEAGTRAAVVIHEWQRGMVDPELSSIPGLAAHAHSRGATGNINRLCAADLHPDLVVAPSDVRIRRVTA